MIVVAARGKARVDDLGLAARDRNAVDPAAAIEDQRTCRPCSQLGASNRVGATWTTRRSVDAIVCVSRVL